MALRRDSGVYVPPPPVYVDPRSARPSTRTAYVAPPPPKITVPKVVAPKQVIAEVGDDFPSLADRVGVDATDLANANKDTRVLRAGAAYNVPAPVDPNADFNVPRALPGESTEDFRARINPQPAQTPAPRQSLLDFLPKPLTKEEAGDVVIGGLQGLGQFDLYDKLPQWLKDVFPNLPDETSALGIGQGAGIGPLGGIPEDVQVAPRTQAEYADFRQAEAAAAYKDREIAAMTGSLGITDIADRQRLQGLESAFTGGFGGPYQIPEGVINLSGEIQGQQPEITNTEALRNMWEDVYLDPANKGRGGGIVGWIEERTGLTIDPETFFIEGASEEVLAAMLGEFTLDELNYLESQGIIVPVERAELPAYGGYGGGYSGSGGYNYPAVSYQTGGYGSGPSQPYQRQSNIGLVSWSGI